MVSQNEALTKDQPNLEGYRLNSGWRADRPSATTAGPSFSGPLREVLDLEQTASPAFTNRKTRTGKKVTVRPARRQYPGLAIATGNPGASDLLMYGAVTITFSAMEVHRRGELVPLTRKEFQALADFLKNARRVISRDELLNEVWGYEAYPCTHGRQPHSTGCARTWSPNRPFPNTFELCMAWDTSSCHRQSHSQIYFCEWW
jgi:hypothetical protein